VPRRRREPHIVAVDIDSESKSRLIMSDDKPGKQDVYLRHLARTGNKPEAAARAHTTKSGVQHWRSDPEFRKREADAVWEASGRLVNKIHHAAMRGDAKAAMWLVEKLNPEDYGKQDAVQITFTAPPRLARPRLSEIPVLEAPSIGDVDGSVREMGMAGSLDDGPAPEAAVRHDAGPEDTQPWVLLDDDNPPNGTWPADRSQPEGDVRGDGR
jgi:hypothetical protein